MPQGSASEALRHETLKSSCPAAGGVAVALGVAWLVAAGDMGPTVSVTVGVGVVVTVAMVDTCRALVAVGSPARGR
jgi:hypothetical protein